MAKHPESSVVLGYAHNGSPNNNNKNLNDSITLATTEAKLNMTSMSPAGGESMRHTKFGGFTNSSRVVIGTP